MFVATGVRGDSGIVIGDCVGVIASDSASDMLSDFLFIGPKGDLVDKR